MTRLARVTCVKRSNSSLFQACANDVDLTGCTTFAYLPSNLNHNLKLILRKWLLVGSTRSKVDPNKDITSKHVIGQLNDRKSKRI